MRHTFRLITAALGVFTLLSISFTLRAQTYDVLDIVASSRDKMAGCEGPYRYDAAALTPAPPLRMELKHLYTSKKSA